MPTSSASDVALVRRLVAAQFPQWADLSIEPVRSAGTDNAIYRGTLGGSGNVLLRYALDNDAT
jgi:aminoglycoside phosphotransferase (APT) family kinase protein